MIIRPRAVAALILPVLAAPTAGWGFNADATQRLHTALMEAADQQAETGQAVDLDRCARPWPRGRTPMRRIPWAAGARPPRWRSRPRCGRSG